MPRYALLPNRLVRPGRSGRRTAATLLASAVLLFGATEGAMSLAQPGSTKTVAATTVAATSSQTSSTGGTAVSATTAPSASDTSSSSTGTSAAATSATPTSATS